MKVRLRELGAMEYKACWNLQQELFDTLLAQKAGAKETAEQADKEGRDKQAGEVGREEQADKEGREEQADKEGREEQADKEGREEQAGELLLVEHPPVYTLGKSGHAENLLIARERLEAMGAQFFHIDRGGDITFHGPGQLVVYPILDLERIGIGLRGYIEALEEAVIHTVAHYGIQAGRIAGASGVWITQNGVAPRKICAIGVRSSRYVTMHGLALNVSTDLGWFAHMNPCGFTDRGVTSIEREVGRRVSMNEVKSLVVKFLEEELNVRIYK